MKRTKCLLLFQLISFPLFSQEAISIEEAMKTMSKGSRNAFVTEIPQTKMKEVASAWKKFVRHETKNSVDKANNEYVIMGTVIQNISSGPINVYSTFLETGNGVKQTAYFTTDDSVFISSLNSEEKSIAVKKFMHDFAVQQYKVAVSHELETERKKFSNLENILDDLIKDNERANKRINEDNRRIDKAKDAIAVNRKEQETRAGEVAVQKETVRSLGHATGEERDREEKKLKVLEKEKKKLEKQNEIFHTDIEELESDIHKQERKIVKNEDAQKDKKEEIGSQKETVKSIEKKLKNIN